LAPPIGFEPMTNWLTARRSTELSHGGPDCQGYEGYQY
jgi:hypothetical protein